MSALKDQSSDLPKVKIGDCEVSRLIVGGNPFSGISHQSPQMDREMRDYYTIERIKETLRKCERNGINTFLGRGDNHIMRLLNEYWNEGGTIKWIAQTAPERESVTANIRQIASSNAKYCFIHGGVMDRLFGEGKADSVEEPLALIKDSGMSAGVAAHNPEVIRYIEEKDFDVDFYMSAFYNLTGRGGGTYLPEDREAACEVIREVEKPVIAYKVMAAGRNAPEEALRYAFDNIKPKDAVVVGMFTKHHPTQVRDNVELVRKLLVTTA